ncbi:hypothetical protein SDC9_157972 [bioreactor metagenome]|uniref:Uncharacterized protein n=1 Tax=bioreactor metagenome TaxID=1076179 RepID=A0A645F8H4_9ZZZZ
MDAEPVFFLIVFYHALGLRHHLFYRQMADAMQVFMGLIRLKRRIVL